MNNDLLITTTDVLQGYVIEEYVGYMCETSVIGTGFLTDIFSSFSDITGTSSDSINNKLELLKLRVIQNLMDKAKKAKCNGLVGLKIDIDEISSGQKMMFMITAAATAVKCHKENELEFNEELKKQGLFKFENIQEAALSISVNKKLAEVSTLIENNKSFDVSSFKEVLSDLVQADLKWVDPTNFFKCVIHYSDYFSYGEKILNLVRDYNAEQAFSAFMNVMYDITVNNKEKLLSLRKAQSFQNLLKVVGELNDYALILKYFECNDSYFNVCIIYPLLCERKNYYKSNDCAAISKILDLMTKSFWPKDKIEYENNRVLAQYRICKCGQLLRPGEICVCGSKESLKMESFALKDKAFQSLSKLYVQVNDYFTYNH